MNEKAARELLKSKPPTDEQLLKEQRLERQLEAQAREHKGIVQALERELGAAALRQDFLDRLALAPDPDPYVIKRLGSQKKVTAPATYFALASDWHIEERVRKENVLGKNEYTPDIARERARNYFKRVILMLDGARRLWDIKQMVLWLGGDLITGYIHEEYLEENFLSPVEASLLLHEIFVGGLKTLLAESDLERILVVTSNGNHGRTGQKMKVATAAKNSFEWLAYQHLRMQFENEPRLEWQIGTGYTNVVDCYGFRIGFHHGDRIGYQGGIGGTTIPANRRMQRQNSGLPPRFEGTANGPLHLTVHGHFHSVSYPGGFIQNGSLIGWNDFAEALGCAFEDPQQVSFVVDERYKVVSNFNRILVGEHK